MVPLAMLASFLICAAILALLVTGSDIAKLKEELARFQQAKAEANRQLEEVRHYRAATISTRALLNRLKEEKISQIAKLQQELVDLAEETAPDRDIVTRLSPDQKPLDFADEEEQ